MYKLNLKGYEQVLDAGCGHRLMLVAAAKKLTTGRATGIDLWQQQDQAGNSPEAALKNAQVEGDAVKVEITNGDLRELPIAEGKLDAVFSSWVIHNIYDAPGREKALKEIARVLKPGGRVSITDIRHSAEYAKVLTDMGLADVNRSGPNFLFFIQTHTVTAQKP